ncbi:MAG: RecQ family ATP-dependent DNA helicase [Phycisphaeraceae bacterium]|nr:RecQ family ATP-dependent DNA helicase [Phycisphaeraceae bacterium]
MSESDETGVGGGAGVDERVLEVVRATFGFDGLRPLQAESIAATLDGRDALTVLPTGGGKSLCYQVPPLVTGRLTLVVSPLIALMRDQVSGMRLAGVPAAAVHSHLEADEKRKIHRQAERGELRILLVAPERLLQPDFLGWVRGIDVGAIAIDEAHCISLWGHDFRPEYRRLARLRELFPGVPLGAFTATATPRVREDIVAQLGLRDPAVLVGVFDRPNLTYRVLPRVDPVGQTHEALVRHSGEAGIVYCLSRKDTEALAGALQARGVSAEAYHAGMDAGHRTRVSEDFRSERLDVVVATVAFGMGIDRGDVRCVVHAAMPKSIEHYQQETGRAGRDGRPAECVLLYSSADVVRWRQLMARGNAEAVGDPDALRDALAAQYELLDGMQRLAGSARCRHRLLSEYFGQAYEPDDCGACDVCLKELVEAPDAHDTARKIISCVARCREGFGAAHIADVLRGSRARKIGERGHDQLSTFGLLAGVSKERLTAYINQLVDAGDLGRTEGEYPTLYLTEQSAAVLRSERTATLVEPKGIPDKPSRSSGAGRAAAETLEPLDDNERALFEALRKARREIATARGVPPFVVLDDNSLHEICRVRPGSLETLVTVRGIGNKKAEAFGEELLDAIRRASGELGLGLDARTGSRPRTYKPEGALSAGSGGSDAPDDARPALSTGAAAAAPLFREGRTVEEVAAALGRARSTVEGYLGEFVLSEKPASIRAWVDEPTQARIEEAAREVGEGRLRPIYERLGGEVGYVQIRLVLAHTWG